MFAPKNNVLNWKDIWPDQNEVARVLRFMHQHWYELVKENMPGFQASSHEPQLTTFFGQSLKDNSYEEKLLGKFTYEESIGKLNKIMGKIEDRGRNDINYFTVINRKQVELIFEFKCLRLKPRDNCKEYYSDNGMGRFVSGKYADRHHLAFMVGMIDSHKLEKLIIPGIKSALSTAPVVSDLNIIARIDGSYINEPSNILEDIIIFDTEHTRSQDSASTNLVIGHMFLYHDEL